MEHSVNAYSKRQTTQRLEKILQDCQQDQEMYGYIVPLVQMILEEKQDGAQRPKGTEYK